jgi:1-deoxy-D-xylulose-5-phosphate synthase
MVQNKHSIGSSKLSAVPPGKEAREGRGRPGLEPRDSTMSDKNTQSTEELEKQGLSRQDATLPAIQSHADLASSSLEQKVALAGELRQRIIETVSRNGGHLAPSLGVVELTIALLSCFDPARDKIIWDVGHQAYVYKLLTGRLERFHTLRTLGGISGFPKRGESPFDHFGVGHSSTSISAALGMAMARDLAKERNKVLAVIGDGSMTAGLAFEGLNQAGHMGRDLIVVLNDNEMSISKNVGALSSFLSRSLARGWLRRFKKESENLIKQLPSVGDNLAGYMRRFESSFKGFFTPGMLFESLKFNYLGPIDGHDFGELMNVFRMVQSIEAPVLVHVLTKKGKGYPPAEENPTYFHGVGSFEPETGAARKYRTDEELPSYTKVFGDTLCRMAEKDSRIVAITAAMPEGTGLSAFGERFPERFVDVGICEQHAVTFAGGLAVQGYRPVVAIYSTFMQRSYDQVLHDVCLQNLPVTLCLDRGGLVGEDGPTHHGAFDLSFLRHIPNITIMAPKDEAELQRMLVTALGHDGPTAIRYPRGVGVGAPLSDDPKPLPLGRAEVLLQGGDLLVLAVGSRVMPALVVAEGLVRERDAGICVCNARFVKPLPEAQLRELIAAHHRILMLEENVLAGGFSSGVLEFMADNGLLADAKGGKVIRRLGLPDAFVEHGTQKELRRLTGIDRTGIRKAMLELLELEE